MAYLGTKPANAVLTSEQIGDGVIATTDLANGAVTNDKLTLVANASNVMTALNASGSAPVYAARAWVNFNGTGTVAIRNSGNVSSITDGGAGSYTINFTSSLPDVNYSCGLSSNTPSGYNTGTITTNGLSASTLNVLITGISGTTNTSADSSVVCVSVFR